MFADFAAVQEAMTQTGADVVITSDATGDTVTVKNVVMANLGADDFLFV